MLDVKNEKLLVVKNSAKPRKTSHYMCAFRNRSLDRTDRARPVHPKRSYERYVLVIHTDEFFLDSDSVERFLKGASFNTSLITDAFLGLSYEPGKGDPVFELELVRA